MSFIERTQYGHQSTTSIDHIRNACVFKEFVRNLERARSSALFVATNAQTSMDNNSSKTYCTKIALATIAKIIDEAEIIFNTLPDDYLVTTIFQVCLPPMSGHCLYKNRTLFGRKRWWELRGNDTCYYLKPTAPATVQEWANHEDLPYFLQLLNTLQPGPLARKLGSNLAALQLVVDVIDHLICNKMLPLSALSSTIIAHLTSATLILNWPSEFLEAGTTLYKWLKGNETPAATDPQRTKHLLKYWERCATTSSASLELACHLRTQMKFFLEKLIADPPPPLPLGTIQSINACIVASSGSATEMNDPATAPDSPTRKVKVYLNKRKEPEPLVEAVLKKSL